MRLWDDNTYNTQERAGIINSLGHTPKPDGAMERLRLPEVLYDNSVVHRTGGSRGSGRGLARLLRKLT
jgi:hypothetical protein